MLTYVFNRSCDNRYAGCTELYKKAYGDKWMTGKPMGAAFFNSNYYYFASWKPETWISFCVTVGEDGRLAFDSTFTQ